MSISDIMLVVALAVIVLPITAYMVMKFGTAGFLRAKRREKQKERNNPI